MQYIFTLQACIGAVVFSGMIYCITGRTEWDARVWSITLGTEWSGHEYLKEDGSLAGYSIEFLDKVCSEGKLDCRFVVDLYTVCWSRHHKQNGLHSRRFDACVGWTHTVQRARSFAFTVAYLTESISTFYVLKGTGNINVTGANIGFIDGWNADPFCIKRELPGVNFREQIYSGARMAVEGLRSGEVDMLMGDESYWSKSDMDDMKPDSQYAFRCFISGNGLMTRKDSPFTEVWNVAYQKYKNTRAFETFCYEQREKHAHKGEVACLHS